jgi:AraC-like DNA-binding protein
LETQASHTLFRTFQPRDPALRGIIAYYYLHHAEADTPEQRFIYYPHYRNAVTCYLRSDVVFQDHYATATPNPDTGVTCLYSRNYDRSIRVSLKPPFTKVGVAFEPLGIHRFIDTKLSDIAVNTVVHFGEFGPEFTALVTEVLNAPFADPTEKLDAFFYKRLRPPEDRSMINLVAYLLAEKEQIPLERLAANHGMSVRSMQRRFRETLVCTPREYRRLIRFRNAVNAYQYASRETSFTELALENNYYDQPAFIKHFKKLTGRTPRDFFAHIRQYGSEDTFWSDQ